VGIATAGGMVHALWADGRTGLCQPWTAAVAIADLAAPTEAPGETPDGAPAR
jgi:hypothetical protein